ncbi:MAG: HAMP domain-containing histidine kinase [Mogibacterium sp.]|nr:HAMP domain-containing histidine kinase [Mogibacterium sp.]
MKRNKAVDVKRSKKVSGISMYFFILRSFVEMVLATIIMLTGISWGSYYVENRLLEEKFGSGILEQEMWPSEVYKTIDYIDRITWTIVGVVFILIVLFFARRIKRHIFIPLEALNKGISDFTLTGKEVEIPTTRLKELDEITWNFINMTERLRDSNRKREAAEEERRRIFAGISHDLRTPITVIKGYSAAINDGLVTNGDAARYIKAIEAKAESLSELINMLYEYSRLEHPSFAPNLKDSDICEFVREYLAAKYEELDIAGCELVVNIPDKQIICSFDAYQMQRVFDNIVNNSVKHNERGVKIYVRINEGEEDIIITVRDSGKGIPQNIGETVFEPMVTGSEYRPGDEGSGLGLSIARMIVKAHGGDIKLLPSSETSGAIFKIIIPKLQG